MSQPQPPKISGSTTLAQGQWQASLLAHHARHGAWLALRSPLHQLWPADVVLAQYAPFRRSGAYTTRAPCFLFPELCFSFPWGHSSRIAFFFVSLWCFSVPVSVSGAQDFFFVPGIGLSATGLGFLVPLGTFGARKGFSCARLK